MDFLSETEFFLKLKLSWRAFRIRSEENTASERKTPLRGHSYLCLLPRSWAVQGNRRWRDYGRTQLPFSHACHVNNMNVVSLGVNSTPSRTEMAKVEQFIVFGRALLLRWPHDSNGN